MGEKVWFREIPASAPSSKFGNEEKELGRSDLLKQLIPVGGGKEDFSLWLKMVPLAAEGICSCGSLNTDDEGGLQRIASESVYQGQLQSYST